MFVFLSGKEKIAGKEFLELKKKDPLTGSFLMRKKKRPERAFFNLI